MKILLLIYYYLLKIVLNLLSIFGNKNIITRIRVMLLTLLRIKSNGNIFIDYGFDCYAPQNISFGKNVSLGHYNKIWAFDKVTIGNYVQTAIGLTIIAGSHENDTYEPKKNQQVMIGDGCWIGANVTILGGVMIGKGCIVGAGSVVNKNMPDFSIVAGVPAKVIKSREPAQKVLNPFGWYDIGELDK